jgi:hypothetical protein
MASRIGAAAVALALLTLTLVHAQGPAVSPQTWQGPNTTSSAAEMFQCIYEAKWPCKPSTAGPSVDQILAKWEEALGGAAALAKVNTRILAQRRFQDVGAPEDHYMVRYTKVRPADRKLSTIMSHTSLDGVFMHWTDGCTPDDSWNWPGRQAKDPAPREDRGADANCENRLYFLYGYGYFPLDLKHLKDDFTFEYKGIHKIFQPPAGPVGEMAGGHGPDLVADDHAHDTYLLLTKAKNGSETAWLYFDTKTGVLLRYANAQLPAGEQPFIYAGYDGGVPGKYVAAGYSARAVEFLQYRKVGDGTTMPFQFVTQTPDTRVRGVTVNVVDNSPIDDKVFLRVKNAFRGDRGF